MKAYEILNQSAIGNGNYFNPNPNSSVAPVVVTTVGTVSVNKQDKVVNDYVYGKNNSLTVSCPIFLTKFL